VWAFVAGFGAGFGAITPARAALVGELVAPAAYGRVSGVLALIVSLARAAAPVGASLLYAAGGGARHGYDAVLVAVLGLWVASGAAVLVGGGATTAAGSRVATEVGPARMTSRTFDSPGALV
jgi:hypothetical protein